jgi:chaperonin GroES
MTNIRPIGDKVVVKLTVREEVSRAGIILPETATEKPQEGEVIAVGSGKIVEGRIMPLEIKVGDRVYFSKYGPTEIKIDGEEYYILSESDILAILE